MPTETRPDLSIPVLGRPLSGKYTFLANVAQRLNAKVRTRVCPVTLGDDISLSARIVACQFATADRFVELWCMPGGSAPEWQVCLASGAAGAILIAEPQPSTFDHQDSFFAAFDEGLAVQWFTVVGKQDLTHCIVPPDEFLPEFSVATPRLVYSALAADAQDRAVSFLEAEVIPSVPSSAYNLEARIAALREERGAA